MCTLLSHVLQSLNNHLFCMLLSTRAHPTRPQHQELGTEHWEKATVGELSSFLPKAYHG